MNNERLYEMPLQINHNIFNLNKQHETRSKDMPKQIKNDVYRNQLSGKENMHQKYETKRIKSPYPIDHQVLFPEKQSSVKKQNNRSTHLRDIIKKKLFDSEKNGLKLQSKNKNLGLKKRQQLVEDQHKPNRYQSLLKQLYGTPKETVQKTKYQISKIKQIKQDQFQMKRHQSVRNINQVLSTSQKQADLGRYRSLSVLQKAPICSDCKSKRKNSSKLRSELSKIPTYLDLYNQKKKLVLLQ